MTKRLISGLVLALTLAACGGQSPATTPPANTTPGAYPSPAPQTSGYPTPQPAPVVEGGYPPPQTEVVLPEGPKFTINTPVKAADTKVCGTGPANVPIRLININRNADVLGQVVIGGDGKYCFDVSGLPSNEIIGLVIGDLSNTEFKREEFLHSDTYVDIPQIGIVFATTSIE